MPAREASTIRLPGVQRCNSGKTCTTMRFGVLSLLFVAAAILTGCAGFFISSTTTTTLTSSSSVVSYESSITLTAKVVSSVATGTVTFYDGSTELGTATLSDGTATYTTSSLSVGTHSLTAVYGGDDTFNGSTSAAITVIVSASLTSTTTALAAPSSSEVYGMSVVLTATVSSTSATGTVRFYDGTTELGTATLNSGIATYTTSTLAVGSHSLTAEYVGDSNYASSTSGVITLTITSAISNYVLTVRLRLPAAAGLGCGWKPIGLGPITDLNSMHFS